MNALHLSRPRAMVVAAATFLPLVALATPASAATTVNFDCQANAPIVGPQKVTFTQDADVTAPATVAPGGALDLVIDPAPNTVPATAQASPSRTSTPFALKIPIPANSTYVSSTLTGGTGLGSTAPTISVSGGVATLSFPGPIAGGAAFELPTITRHLTAGGSGTIETKLAAPSYTDPGLTFNAVVSSIIATSRRDRLLPQPQPRSSPRRPSADTRPV